MCDCNITYKEIQAGIEKLAETEYRHRCCRDFWSEPISYTCSTCKNEWLELGEIINCPRCKKFICIYCLS